MNREARDDGSGAVDYLAVVLLISVISGAFLVSGVGATVVDTCEDAICRVMGGDCARENPPALPGAGQALAAPAPASPAPAAGAKSPPRPPITKPVCTPDPTVAWTEGLHTHNDYQNGRPLHDSLEHGATSVEADVWLDENGELMLRHLPDEPYVGSFRDLYVNPLKARAAENGGKIYAGRDQQFQLLIEIKQGGPAAYEKVLEEIKDLPPNVHVIFDAGRPDDAIGKQPSNVSFDISPGEGCTLPPKVDPADPQYDRAYARNFTMLNASYKQCVDRNKDGKISKSEQADFNAIVQKAHDAGLKVRIVEGPDGPKRKSEPGEFKACSSWIPWQPSCKDDEREAFWQAELEAGVDVFDTSHISLGRKWLRNCGRED
ncbi:hypothetical protein [Actinomadura sp. HBU206391]|uniref:hypothetical protein n=1 Tax=Actinomadura sp. HBU206391 TaxID=2731692 RepID=UPI00164F0F47|nr:hypothetical protein [Actinomadura sp. HBU206391]MBC6463586.1 hypothetical protein [Actinomadura sp. HBU206391]